MAAAVEAIGVISGLLGIFQFFQDELPSQDTSAVKFRLSVANDGNNGQQGPSNAGGNAPDVRVWGPTIEFLGITTNDNTYCGSGDTVCDFQVGGVNQAPDYALFTANNDAICLTTMRTTYPDSSKYSVVIGQWAQACSNQCGVSQATWYYTSNTIKTQDNGNVNVMCSWMDANGDQPTTGIQVQWPMFNGNSRPYNSEDVCNDFCNNNAILQFHTDNDPNSVTYYGKRDELTQAKSTFSPRQARSVPQKRSGSSHQFSHMLVKSALPGQTASYICTAKGAAGPSFVSYEERAFCHMPTKEVYPFCEDVAAGACYDDAVEAVVPKLVANVADLVLPVLNFTDVAHWTDFVAI